MSPPTYEQIHPDYRDKGKVGNHVPRNEIKVGMTLIGDPTILSCWKNSSLVYPLKITAIMSSGEVKRQTLEGKIPAYSGNAPDGCACNDRDNLYEWIPNNSQSQSSNPKSFMSNLSEKLVLAFKADPEKTFRKLAITNGDDILTDDGTKLFLSWQLSKMKQDFFTEVAKPLLDEQEKGNK